SRNSNPTPLTPAPVTSVSSVWPRVFLTHGIRSTAEWATPYPTQTCRPTFRGARMKAVTWHGKRDVRVDTVPDPKIEEPTDAIIEVTSTNICGSDLHLYETLGPFMKAGDILGHEPMGIVREVGSAVDTLVVGDRVVIPFQISCGSCYMCDRQLFTQCETTQVRAQGMGAALF